MAGIEKFLAENPDFQGEDQQQVADFVFETQFQGVDRAEFDEFFLGHKPGIMGKIGRGVDAVVGAVQGDAEFPEMGNIQTIDAGNSAKVGMASVFGDDEDYTKALVDANPDSQVTQDKNGNPMLTLKDGSQAYINEPGLDAEDVTRFAGKALSFVPAGALAVKAAGKGLLARIGVAGGAAGATDAGMQVAAGRDEVDPGQVAMTAILGAGAEAASIPLGAAAKWASTKFKNWKGMTPERRGAILAKKMELTDLTEQQYKRLGQLDEAGELIDPGAKAADAEFGFQLTRGQAMPTTTAKDRSAQFNQLSKEEALKSSASGQRFRDVTTGNIEKTASNIDDITGTMSGGKALSDNAHEAADIVSGGIQAAERGSKSLVDDAYTRARQHALDFDEDWVAGLSKNVKASIKGADVAIDSLTPAAKSALKTLKKENRTSLEAIDRVRRVVSRSYDKAANNEDRRAVKLIKDALDDQIELAVDAGLFLGDDEAVKALKEARGLHAEYAKKFRDSSEAGKVVQKLLDPDITPEQLTQFVIGVNGLTKPGAARVVSKYRGAVGVDSEGYKALREMTFLTLVKKPTGDIKGGQDLVSTLKRALNGKGKSMMNELYTPTEIGKIKRFAAAVEKTLPTGDFAKSSGTAERLMRMYNSTFADTPFFSLWNRFKDSMGTDQALRLPKAPAARVPLLEGTAAVNAQ